MAKPMLVTVPGLLLALDLWPLGRLRRGAVGEPRPTWPGLVVEKIPLFALSAISALVTVWTQRTWGAVASLGAISWPWRFVNAAVSLVTYLVKTVWPSSISCFVPHPATLHPLTSWIPLAIGSAVLLLGISAWALRARRAHPYLLVGWVWYLVMIGPVIGILQVGDQAWASRYAYLPLIGVSLMAAFGTRDLIGRRPEARPVAAAFAVVVLAAFGVSAWAQTRTWRASLTLFEHALRIAPDNWFAHNALGAVALDQGRLDEARAHVEAAIRILPSYADANDNLCIVSLDQNRPLEAVAAGRRALELRPRFPEAHANLAIALLALGRWADAREHLEEALRESPDLLRAELALATLLATAPDPALRDPARAIEVALDAVRRTGSRDPRSLAVLASAYAAAGH
ncbi:MAG: tetratricopeptide repeat protein, partial [Candidatus Eisenbacteria bacterium]